MGGLPVSALIASGMLALLNPGVALARFGGLMVGGAVGLWFLVAGLIWLPSIRSLRRPSLADLAWGVGMFAVLTLAFGVMAYYVWLPWWLNLPRLARWPLLALACLPWFLAAGMAQRGAGAGVRVLWWLVQSLTVTGGLFLALLLAPSLGFLLILLPLMPLLLGSWPWPAPRRAVRGPTASAAPSLSAGSSLRCFRWRAETG